MKVKEMFEELQKLMKEKPEVAELDIVITGAENVSKKVGCINFSIGHFDPEWGLEEGTFNSIEDINEYNEDFSDPNEQMNATINACSIDF